MSRRADRSKSRRDFLCFLAASPLFALPRFHPSSLMNLLPLDPAEHAAIRREIEELQQSKFIITSPDQALDVFEFEAAARKALPPAHFGYLATGVDDDATVRANHEAYAQYQIRSRRLVDVEHIDTSVRLLGTLWNTPIVICPVGAQRAFHPEGEIATARAARAKGHLQIFSTAATASVEDVTAARGAPVWYQLYANNVWEVVRTMIKRAESAGCPALALTVDIQVNSNRETAFRSRRYDSRQCSACHAEGFSGYVRHRPMFDGQDVSKVTGLMAPNLTWDYVKRLKDTTTMKVFLKGIVTREDTELALLHGVDGILVSNHGGRSEETLRPTLECLPEVVQAAGGKIPVLVDGGIRRGTDIFKAMALGASAVGIGRPYIWGLASFGQAGVEAVLAILQRELQTIMRQAGAPSIEKITPAYLAARSH